MAVIALTKFKTLSKLVLHKPGRIDGNAYKKQCVGLRSYALMVSASLACCGIETSIFVASINDLSK